MTPRQIVRQAFKEAKEEHRKAVVLASRMHVKTRQERRQPHVMHVLRRDKEVWRMRGVLGARGCATKILPPLRPDASPTERLYQAAFDMGFEDENRRLALIGDR
jgi:hypothetical protein